MIKIIFMLTKSSRFNWI